MDLLSDVVSEMTCKHCGSRAVTYERLARESGVALRTVVRFLQGRGVSQRTHTRLHDWVLARAIARAATD